MEVIDRRNIIDYAKEKGLYIDLKNLSEKDKNNKNFKADPSKTELTDEIMVNAYIGLMEEKETEVKRMKMDSNNNNNNNNNKGKQ